MTPEDKDLELALFDLDNTLLSGDSDYEWAQFLVERGVLERVTHPVAVDPDEILRREASARGWQIISLE